MRNSDKHITSTTTLKIENCIVGFELSYLDDKLPFIIEDGYSYVKDSELYNKRLEDIKGLKVHVDCGCFEINSPVFDNEEDAVKFFDTTTKKMKKLGFVTHSVKTDGGGLHFHLDIPPTFKVDDYLRLVRTFNRLPYLNWIFNNPVDTSNGNNNSIRYRNLIHASGEPRETINDFIALKAFDGSKSCGIRFETDGNNRVEYRIFDMPYNTKEFRALYKFITEFYKCCTNGYIDGTLNDNQLACIEDISTNAIITYFKAVLSKLSLDYKDYEVFVKRNMLTRYKYGKEYLV